VPLSRKHRGSLVVQALHRSKPRNAPDHKVLNRFRNQLVDLPEKLIAELDRQLENASVILNRGTMLGATLIQAVSAPSEGGTAVERSGRPVCQAKGHRADQAGSCRRH
jgi:hypothetical protein